jgi:aminoglycoside 6'-N-acetyltransferase
MCDRIGTPRIICGCEPSVSDVVLRRAQSSDVSTLERWEKAEHVRAVSGQNEPWEWEHEINVTWQEVWICEVDARPIGVVIVLDAANEPSNYWGESSHRPSPGTYAIDIWIGESDALGRGYGTLMMEHAIARAFNAHAAHTIVIDPLATNRRAIAFYRRLGFTDVGPRRFGNDDCLVLELLRS